MFGRPKSQEKSFKASSLPYGETIWRTIHATVSWGDPHRDGVEVSHELREKLRPVGLRVVPGAEGSQATQLGDVSNPSRRDSGGRSHARAYRSLGLSSAACRAGLSRRRLCNARHV